MIGDNEFRESINANLVNDKTFVEGIKFIEDVESRKHLLLPEWKECQEAGAYWIGLKAVPHNLLLT